MLHLQNYEGSCMPRAPSVYGASGGRLRSMWDSGGLNVRSDMLLISVLERSFWRLLKLMMYWSKLQAGFAKSGWAMRFIQGAHTKFRFLTPCLLNLSLEMCLLNMFPGNSGDTVWTEVDLMAAPGIICLCPEPLAYECYLIWRKSLHLTLDCMRGP